MAEGDSWKNEKKENCHGHIFLLFSCLSICYSSRSRPDAIEEFFFFFPRLAIIPETDNGGEKFLKSRKASCIINKERGA